jgi:hypothetical protein
VVMMMVVVVVMMMMFITISFTHCSGVCLPVLSPTVLQALLDVT